MNDPIHEQWGDYCVKNNIGIEKSYGYDDDVYGWEADYAELLVDAAKGVPLALKLLFKFKAGL